MTDDDHTTRRLRDVKARHRVRELIAPKAYSLQGLDDLAWLDALVEEVEALRAEVIELREAGAEAIVCTADPGEYDMRAQATVGAFVRVSKRTLDQMGDTSSFQHFVAGTLAREMARGGSCTVDQAWATVRRWLDAKQQREGAVKRLRNRRLP